MDADPKELTSDLANRIQGHFESENTDEVVRRSQELMLYPNMGEPHREASVGPVLAHPKSKQIPLNAYLASALTGLSSVEKALIVHLSDITSMVCRAVDIDLYEPRKNTDPVHHANVLDTDVFKIDRQRVVSSDLLIHLCH